MRESRIPHPRAGRFILIHEWAVRAVGHSAAAVVGLLDFYDRTHDRAGEPLAMRARIVADLAGIVGRNAVDAALRDLVERGWLAEHKVTHTGRNITTTHWYRLRADVIAQHLAAPGIAGVPVSGHRVSPNRDQNGDAHLLQEKDIAATARGGDSNPGRSREKVRRARPSGIVTWTPDDVAEAERLEAARPGEEISAAVAAVSATGKDPVPGLIEREIEKAARRRAAAARAAAVEQDRRSATSRADAWHRASLETRVAPLCETARRIADIGAQKKG